ncbi:MAG: tetratricopeptide repeat protein [Kiritimatiellae bacterium]|nr:tetratricopeptide repeat protein [Kiritimatiellia bacterium]
MNRCLSFLLGWLVGATLYAAAPVLMDARDFKPDPTLLGRLLTMDPAAVRADLEDLPAEEAVGYALALAVGHRERNMALAKQYGAVALEIARKHKRRKAEGTALLLLADLADAKNELATATAHLEAASAIFREEGPDRLLIGSLRHLGNVTYRYGTFDKSLAAYESLVKVARRAGDKSLENETSYHIAEILHRTGNPARAKALLTPLVDAFGAAGNAKGSADCHKLLGNLYSAEGDRAKAREHYAMACRAYDQTGDPHGQANCLFNLGLLAKEAGKYDEAVAQFDRALLHYTRAASVEGAGIVQMELGRVFFLGNELGKAESALRQAKFLLSEANAVFRLAQTERYLGDLYARQNRPEAAFCAYEAAVQHYRHLVLTNDAESVSRKLDALRAQEK